MRVERLESPLGLPCNAPPWGRLAAIDLAGRELRWQVASGAPDAPWARLLGLEWGSANRGAPRLTGSGLVLLSAARDDGLRVVDGESGETLFHAPLPRSGDSTPLLYRGPRSGRTFVVIEASPPGVGGARRLVAFALPEDRVSAD